MPRSVRGKVSTRFPRHEEEVVSETLSWRRKRLTIHLHVVARCSGAVDAKQSHHATPHLGHELATIVGHKTERDTEPGQPCLYESTSHSVSDVRQWSSYRPSSEVVHTGEQVYVTPGEVQGAHNVYVDVLEPGGD